MKARVKVDAFPDHMLAGLVTAVSPLPDPADATDPDRKVYTTWIAIGGGKPHLRPKMTAEARIVAADLEDVLTAPDVAVVHYDDKDHVAVKAADGRVEWRDVVLGASDGAICEVKDGLRAGDRVILEPEPFLSDEQRARRDATPEPAPPKAAVRKKGRGTAPPPR
jgi:HlyD family secretion protein